MKIWHGYDWNEITSPNDLGKIYCHSCKLYDAYHTLIDGEHILLLKISISKSWMKQNDENLSELELKSFWYKSHKQVFVRKWIWLYLSQFLTIFDEPKTQSKIINVVTRVCNACDRLTDCNQLKLVFERF